MTQRIYSRQDPRKRNIKKKKFSIVSNTQISSIEKGLVKKDRNENLMKCHKVDNS